MLDLARSCPRIWLPNHSTQLRVLKHNACKTRNRSIDASKPLDSTESTETSRSNAARFSGAILPNHSTQLRVLKRRKITARHCDDALPNHSTQLRVLKLAQQWSAQFLRLAFQTTRLNWEYWNKRYWYYLGAVTWASKPLDSTESTET